MKSRSPSTPPARQHLRAAKMGAGASAVSSTSVLEAVRGASDDELKEAVGGLTPEERSKIVAALKGEAKPEAKPKPCEYCMIRLCKIPCYSTLY